MVADVLSCDWSMLVDVWTVSMMTRVTEFQSIFEQGFKGSDCSLYWIIVFFKRVLVVILFVHPSPSVFNRLSEVRLWGQPPK